MTVKKNCNSCFNNSNCDQKKYFEGKKNSCAAYEPSENLARYNRLEEQLKRAEESGNMVNQNLIMEEMAKLETGWDWI
jgi:hypothetical protein